MDLSSFDIEPDDLKTVSPEMAAEFRRTTDNVNARISGVRYGNDCIVVRGSTIRNVDYYLGFEYVEPENVTRVQDRGDEYAIYWAGSDRVSEVIGQIKAVEPAPSSGMAP